MIGTRGIDRMAGSTNLEADPGNRM